ncbi:MAG TPA: class I SAM-dependent methyltransferase [Gemmatimonadaceae bacterium]|nr:class I SAM-dependent methyltransferase [Gemmatimonadaceae bacterium]
MTRRDHWQAIYRHREATEVSWYQAAATVSVELIRRAASERDDPIIDVGGGASTVVDGLLDAGYRAITVLDLAPDALAVAQARLGARAAAVNWIAADVLETSFERGAFAVWHDRAVFHFLTRPTDRARYIAQVRRAVRDGGHVIVASFALDGPSRCSGLDVMRYSPESMRAEFGEGFRLVDSVREDHRTPSGATQAFVYCLCKVV